jgi:adiponectin receptor
MQDAHGVVSGTSGGGGGFVSGRRLPAPHFAKNQYIGRGYRIHASPGHALSEAVGVLHNETANIATGLLAGGVGVWVALSAWRASGAVSDTHASLLYAIAGLLMFNSACVTAYHGLCSVPHLYHAVSALDLAGVSLLALAIAAGSALPGMRASATALAPWLGESADPVAWLTVTYTVTIALVSVAMRVSLRRESPRALLVLNSTPYWLLIPDWVLARWPAWSAAAMPGILVVGVVLFATKVPERFFPGRFDFWGHSHMLWHTAYAISCAIFSADALAAALAAGPTAPMV